MTRGGWQLLLFDDRQARGWTPFAQTRPIGELRFGTRRLREHVERWAGRPCTAHLAGSQLAGWDEPGAPPVRGTGDAPPGGLGVGEGRLIWLSRAVPREPCAELGGQALTFEDEAGVVGWWLPPDVPGPSDEQLCDPDGFTPGRAQPISTLRLAGPWQLVDHNAPQIALDVVDAARTDVARLNAGVFVEGEQGVVLDAGSRVGPGVVLDVREGPIHLGAGVQVDGPARLVGPLSLGAGSVVFGGHLERVSCGVTCKLRGEIADTVLLDFVNKAHDGYLGHAVLGRWVNLGAGTTNSDLKNTYGRVRVDLGRGPVDTGSNKVGIFLGDHVKTGIGTLLTTGAVVGAGSNVFGGSGVIPRHVEAFSWGGPGRWDRHDWQAFESTLHTVMARRNEVPTEGVLAVLHRLWLEVDRGP